MWAVCLGAPVPDRLEVGDQPDARALLTAAGRQVAAARQERSRQVVAWLQEEGVLGDTAWQFGIRGVVADLLRDHEDPSLARALTGLGEEWLPAREASLSHDGRSSQAAGLLRRSRHFRDLLQAEVE